VGVERSREGSLHRWYRFNVSVSTRDERQRDKILPKDETEVASLPWLNGKKA
jgi:hypothetical protein